MRLGRGGAIAAAALALALLCGCSVSTTHARLRSAVAEPPVALALVPVVWRVRDAPGEASATWLRFDEGQLDLIRPEGDVDLGWRTQGDAIITQLDGWSASLESKRGPTAPWLTRAARIDRVLSGWTLRDAAGHVTARLVRDGAPPHATAFGVAPPRVTTYVRDSLADAVPGNGVGSVTPSSLVGRWGVPGVDPTLASVTFSAQGRWRALSTCELAADSNGGAGLYRLLPTGMLLVTQLPTAGVGCGSGPAHPTPVGMPLISVGKTGSLRIQGTTLFLFDRSGRALGSLQRLP